MHVGMPIWRRNTNANEHSWSHLLDTTPGPRRRSSRKGVKQELLDAAVKCADRIENFPKGVTKGFKGRSVEMPT